MAKARSNADKEFQTLLDALQNGLHGRIILLQGTKTAEGFFGGGVKAKAIANKAIEDGYLEKLPAPADVEKKLQKKEHARLTSKGRELVINEMTPKDAIEQLLPIVDELTKQLQKEQESTQTSTSVDAPLVKAFTEQFAPALDQVLEQSLQKAHQQFEKTIETKLKKPFQEMEKSMNEALSTFEAPSEEPTTERLRGILQGVQRSLERVSAEIASSIQAPAPTESSTTANQQDGDWHENMVRFVEQRRGDDPNRRFTFTELFEKVRTAHSNLTLPQFHEGLRQLQTAGKIRLYPFTQALATLPDPENALYLDREVKFYVG